MEREGTADTAKDLATAAKDAQKSFYEAMRDDFNTALAISYLFAVAKDINVYYNDVVNRGVAFDAAHFSVVRQVFDDMAEVIGILETPAEHTSDEDATVAVLVEERLVARKTKNWARADEIRDALKAKGILLEDSAAGTRWKRV